MDRDRILDEYRNGDQDKRMSLFLYYRELREEFNDVEQESPPNLYSIQQASPGKNRIPQKVMSAFQTLSYYVRSHFLPDQVRH